MPKALSTNRQHGSTVVTLTWIHIYREPQLKKSSQGITEKKKKHRKRTKPEEAISREEAEENVREESGITNFEQAGFFCVHSASDRPRRTVKLQTRQREPESDPPCESPISGEIRSL